MGTESKDVIRNSWASLPKREVIQCRLAENIRERQALRQMLKMIDKVEAVDSRREGRRRD